MALLPAVSVVCLVLSVTIDAGVLGATGQSDLTDDAGWPTAATGVAFAICAAVILRHQRNQGLGWALAWFGLFWATDGLAESYLQLGLGRDEPLAGMTFVAWFVLRFTALLPATVAVVLALFPTGHVLPGRWGLAVKVGLGVMVANAALFVVIPSGRQFSADKLPPGTDPDPTSIDALAGNADAIRAVSLAASLVAIGVVMVAVVVRYRRSRDLDRERMRWLAWAVTAMALLILAGAVVDVGRFEALLFFVIVNLGPAAMAVAVVRPDLVDIDDLLARTLTYGGLSVMIVAVDVAVLAGLTSVLDERLDQRQVVLTVLLLTTVLYGPLRQRVWVLVRRLVLGERGTPYGVVAGLASTLERSDRGAEQLAAVADAVAAAFGLGFVRLEVDRPDGGRIAATHGTEPAEVRTTPITFRDHEVGRVVLPVRGLRSRLSRRDEALLADLARQAITAVRTSQLADELQASREGLVVAREEERRRIRRDLHDGLGPSLSGVVFQLESARLLVDREPAEAQRSIASVSTLVQDVVADVRRLVHDLRPPALDDLGLVGALRQQAERMSGGDLAVSVHATDLGQLSAAVEVAAYRIAGEALTNVARHAAARRADVRLTVADDRLQIEVSDDGRGIPADVQAGVGLVSLRERAAELGGRTEVSCPADAGTVVRAWLPLSRTRPTNPEEDRT